MLEQWWFFSLLLLFLVWDISCSKQILCQHLRGCMCSFIHIYACKRVYIHANIWKVKSKVGTNMFSPSYYSLLSIQFLPAPQRNLRKPCYCLVSTLENHFNNNHKWQSNNNNIYSFTGCVECSHCFRSDRQIKWLTLHLKEWQTLKGGRWYFKVGPE